MKRARQQEYLAQAIRRGLEYAGSLRRDLATNVLENPHHYLSERPGAHKTWDACAIGHAILGTTYSFPEACTLVHQVWFCHHEQATREMCKIFAVLLGVDSELIRDIDEAQVNRDQTISSLLTDLEAGTFSLSNL